MTELVHYEVDRGASPPSPSTRRPTATRSRPQLVGELGAHLAAAGADDAVRAVVLTHTGATFCAGADLKEQSAEGGPASGTQRMLGLLRADRRAAQAGDRRASTAHVRAGGIGLVGACDIAVAGPATTFAFTEVRLGLAPAIISLTTLGRMTRAGGRALLPDRRDVRRRRPRPPPG